MNDKYILNKEGKPVPEPDLLKWARWFEEADNRQVAVDLIGKFKVSTIFLGLNHAFDGGEPILWETMVFPTHEMTRCRGSREQAEAMHARMVQKVTQKETA